MLVDKMSEDFLVPRPAPMHVVLISPSWPLGVPNGIVTYVHHLRNGLRALGHRVSVLCLTRAEESAADGVFCVSPSPRNKLWRSARRRLGFPVPDVQAFGREIAESVMRLHAKDPVDVVEMEESFGWFSEVQACLPMPVVVKLHGPAFLSFVEEELLLPATQAKIQAEREALQAARFVVSPSLDTLDRTREHCGLPATWGRVLANPIVMPTEAPRWSAHNADARKLLFVGRFDKRKGGDLVIQAFSRLLKHRADLRLMFVGPDIGVTCEDGSRLSLREFVEREIPAGNLAQIEILGKLSQSDIVRLRCQAALTLVCSRWDNQPNTALEASFQGCPIVGFESGGLSEVVKHGVTGLLAKQGDLDGLCELVLRLIDNPTEAESYGVAGREYVVDAHGLPKLSLETAKFYESVIAQQSR